MSTSALHAGTATERPAAGPLSVASFVLGIVSVVAGWTFVVPLVSVVLGIQALRREPQSKTLAVWGLVLSGIMMSFWILFAVLALAIGAVWVFTLPWVF
ncbi:MULTISPECIES: hypothetical protein [Bacteria]|uniref:hypothetical protein n=1 Tax=Bacteria TaxID=2 RepID=UPI003C7B0842